MSRVEDNTSWSKTWRERAQCWILISTTVPDNSHSLTETLWLILEAISENHKDYLAQNLPNMQVNVEFK